MRARALNFAREVTAPLPRLVKLIGRSRIITTINTMRPAQLQSGAPKEMIERRQSTAVVHVFPHVFTVSISGPCRCYTALPLNARSDASVSARAAETRSARPPKVREYHRSQRCYPPPTTNRCWRYSFQSGTASCRKKDCRPPHRPDH